MTIIINIFTIIVLLVIFIECYTKRTIKKQNLEALKTYDEMLESHNGDKYKASKSTIELLSCRIEAATYNPNVKNFAYDFKVDDFYIRWDRKFLKMSKPIRFIDSVANLRTTKDLHTAILTYGSESPDNVKATKYLSYTNNKITVTEQNRCLKDIFKTLIRPTEFDNIGITNDDFTKSIDNIVNILDNPRKNNLYSTTSVVIDELENMESPIENISNDEWDAITRFTHLLILAHASN